MLTTIIRDNTRHWSLPPNNLFSVLKSVKFPCGFWGRRNTKVELTFCFSISYGEFHWSGPTNTKVLMFEVKIAWVQHWLNEQPIQARVITKKFALLTPIKMRVLVFWGCPLWALVCWMNTRSVCRICQINFNSERIWAVNTQEIAWLVWAWSVIQGVAGGGVTQRRQEERKMCQGNGIILCNLKCLCGFYLTWLRQLCCSIHVMEA